MFQPALTVATAVLCASPASTDHYQFEALGVPVTIRNLPISVATRDPLGHWIAWGGITEAGLGGTALIGVRTDNGEATRHDLSRYGAGKIALLQGADENLYVYAGSPAHFLRYDAGRRQLEDLGVPVKHASYFSSGALGPDGRFYIGSYPTASLVSCDTRTLKIENLGRLPTDDRQCYIYPAVAVSDDAVVYAPVGLHHAELWAYDTKSRVKKQILPESFNQRQGSPQVWKGTDGQVYAECGGVSMRCKPDGVEAVKTVPNRARTAVLAGDHSVGEINQEGKLRLTDLKTKKTTWLPTNYDGRPAAIFSVACQRDGKIYGSSLLPGHTFSCDTATGRLADLGILDSGQCQVYDTISLPRGLFLASYFGAYVDLFDPSAPLAQGKNPRPLGHAPGQERPVQWCLGPDGMLYTGTVPAKGRLGGALLRVDPNDLSLKVWPCPIANQSIMYAAPLPESSQLYCVTSIHGGSSAIPTEKEAYAFLWDLSKETIVSRLQPVPGTREYGRAILARNGRIYGLAGGNYYVFEPRAGRVVFTGRLPVTSVRFPGLNDDSVGSRGLMVGLGDDAVFAIDPADNRAKVLARHQSLTRAHGFYITDDGVLYYGSGATLMRCKLGL